MFIYNAQLRAERWQSGRMRRTRNPVWGFASSRVRIPPFPPLFKRKPLIFKGFFLFWLCWCAMACWLRLGGFGRGWSSRSAKSSDQLAFTMLQGACLVTRLPLEARPSASSRRVTASPGASASSDQTPLPKGAGFHAPIAR